MSGGNIADDGKNSVLIENIVEGQVTHDKLTFSELMDDFVELNLPQGRNCLTEDGIVKQVGRVVLTDGVLYGINSGNNVDALSFDAVRFLNAISRKES